MVFDKTKAMRSAEQFLAQGKIQSAIGEYKRVIAHDSKDFGTLNALGDLYTKTLDKKHAIECYTSVAEHYSKQGFAQKAIAIYNKICRIQPDSIDISAKLADLYKFKGAVNEARTHYNIVIEHYESEGRKLEALEIRRQMASLDPSDTSVYIALANAYLDEDQSDDAADAFAEAAQRFAKKSQHSDALEALEKALELKPTDPAILAAFVQAQFANGTPAAAAVRLAEIQIAEPHNQDVLGLLVDCFIEAGDGAEAEKNVISLVEKEPTLHPKFLDLARVYLNAGDASSAARVTAMASEHLLLAGQPEVLDGLLAEILSLDAEQLEGVRLRARLAAWQRDEAGMFDSLVLLARIAKDRDSVDDERFALSQLVMVAPLEVGFAERLRELNQLHGFDDAESNDNLFDKFLKPGKDDPEPELETFAVVTSEAGTDGAEITGEADAVFGFEIVDEFASIDNAIDHAIDHAIERNAAAGADLERLLREIDSIRFYVDSDYFELAAKAIADLRSEFGEHPEIDALAAYMASRQGFDSVEVKVAAEVEVNEIIVPAVPPSNGNGKAPPSYAFQDLRSELGMDEAEAADDSDYETHYHTAIAYQEMGMLDEAIKEYQEAIGLVRPNDPTRRFFQCANLLGHCFMQKAMANLALTWYQRALETPGLSDEEKQGIWYELASAYEAEGDHENAGRYFEQVYAENIDFRDVSERVKNMTVSR